MFKQLIVISISILLLAVATGCARSTHLSTDYGRSYDALFASQVINPDAPKDRTPVEGMPGYIASQIYNDIYIPSLTGTEDSGTKGGMIRGR